MKNSWLALCIVTLAMHSMAQSPSCNLYIKGVVREAGTHMPLSDVAVYISGTQLGSYTDQQGGFTISGACEGEWELIARHLNHEEKRERIALTQSVSNKVIYMHCHTDTLHMITVKSSRIHWEDVIVGNTLSTQSIFRQSGNSLGKTLEAINGVFSLSTGPQIQKPVIRGMHSNRIVTINNELRQEGQQWGLEHAPEIEPSQAERIELIKGAQTIRYGGDIIGGLVILTPPKWNTIDTFSALVHSGFMTNGRMVHGGIKLQNQLHHIPSVKWMLQGNYKRSGNVNSPDYFLKNTGLAELSYSAAMALVRDKWTLDFYHSVFTSRIGIFAGSHIGNLTDLYQAFARQKPIDSAGFSYRIDLPFQQVAHHTYKLRFQKNWNNIGEFSAILGLQQNVRKEYDRTLASKQENGSYSPALHFNLQTLNYELNLAHKIAKPWQGHLGANGLVQQNQYLGRYFIPDFIRHHGGAYVVEKWHQNALSFELGARYDITSFSVRKWEQNQLFDSTHAYGGFAGSAAIRYQFPLFTVHASLGTAWRAPHVNELYSYGVHHSAATFEVGDRSLRKERSYQSAVTFDFAYKKKVDMELTFFQNIIHNYIYLKPVFPATLTIRGAFPTLAFTQTQALFTGIEWSLSSLLFRDVRLSHKANIIRVQNLRNKEFIVGIPPARFDADIEVPFWKNKSSLAHFSMGTSYTAKQRRVLDAQEYVPIPPAYFLASSSLSMQTILYGYPLQMQLGVNNLFNTRYRDYLNRNRNFADEIGRNVFINLKTELTNNKNNYK